MTSRSEWRECVYCIWWNHQKEREHWATSMARVDYKSTRSPLRSTWNSELEFDWLSPVWKKKIKTRWEKWKVSFTLITCTRCKWCRSVYRTVRYIFPAVDVFNFITLSLLRYNLQEKYYFQLQQDLCPLYCEYFVSVSVLVPRFSSESINDSRRLN